MKKFWDLYVKAPWERKILGAAFALALLPIAAGAIWNSTATPAPSEGKSTRAQVDTYIPKGFVLVPIEVQNYESLDSILGQFGVVDLFQAGGGAHPQQVQVARNVRMLRAPQNPSHFAILVQESEVSGILKNNSAFFVVVKYPGKDGTQFVKKDVPAGRSIVYERN